ncbi:MAG: protease modulator HflK [Planctomycetota bacterium]
MADQNRKNTGSLLTTLPKEAGTEQLDTAGKSLADALKVSFTILKIIMVVLVLFFMASGFFIIAPEEQGLVLRFGRICGLGEQRLRGPGAFHWAFPYPIDEIIKIPVKKVMSVPIESFWYEETDLEKLGIAPNQRPFIRKTLDPRRDGYCLTRNENIAGVSGNDYNIVHTKWRLTYVIGDPELFFKNIYVRDVKPGESYADVIPQSATSLLRALARDAIVATMVNFSIDEAIRSEADIAARAKILLQQKLDAIDSGIEVKSMELYQSNPPRQVADDFRRSTEARQEKQTLKREAESYARNLLIDAGGSMVDELLSTLQSKNTNEEHIELLWSGLTGTAREIINQAQTYRTQVVQSAKANSDYFKAILPEYRQRPKLVIQKIYQQAVEEVLEKADEKIIIEPSIQGQKRQLRIQLNRDPAAKPKKQ